MEVLCISGRLHLLSWDSLLDKVCRSIASTDMQFREVRSGPNGMLLKK